MDGSRISSSSATATVADADASVNDVGTSQSSPTSCRDLPLKPVWMMEDTLLVYSPPGLLASRKVAIRLLHAWTTCFV